MDAREELAGPGLGGVGEHDGGRPRLDLDEMVRSAWVAWQNRT